MPSATRADQTSPSGRSKAPKASTKVVFAEAHAHGVAGVGSRLVGGQQHRAADGVAAEQGSLRAAQDLHVGDVAEFHGRAHRAAHVDIVDVYADARVDRGRGIASGRCRE